MEKRKLQLFKLAPTRVGHSTEAGEPAGVKDVSRDVLSCILLASLKCLRPEEGDTRCSQLALAKAELARALNHLAANHKRTHLVSKWAPFLLEFAVSGSSQHSFDSLQ